MPICQRRLRPEWIKTHTLTVTRPTSRARRAAPTSGYPTWERNSTAPCRARPSFTRRTATGTMPTRAEIWRRFWRNFWTTAGVVYVTLVVFYFWPTIYSVAAAVANQAVDFLIRLGVRP